MKNLFCGISVEINKGGKQLATNLTFKIESGAILLLKGKNGAGKSTLLRVMAGLSNPASGKLFWNDEDIGKNIPQHYRRLTYVGHSTAVKSDLTIKENLKYWLHLNCRQKKGERQLKESLETFNLAGSSNLPARFLSSGQTRKLALARLTLKTSPLWLLDEPTVGLDEPGLTSLSFLLNSHCEHGGIAVIASHDLIQVECPVHALNIEDCKKD